MSTRPRHILLKALTNGNRSHAARPAHASPAVNKKLLRKYLSPFSKQKCRLLRKDFILCVSVSCDILSRAAARPIPTFFFFFYFVANCWTSCLSRCFSVVVIITFFQSLVKTNSIFRENENFIVYKNIEGRYGNEDKAFLLFPPSLLSLYTLWWMSVSLSL